MQAISWLTYQLPQGPAKRSSTKTPACAIMCIRSASSTGLSQCQGGQGKRLERRDASDVNVQFMVKSWLIMTDFL